MFNDYMEYCDPLEEKLEKAGYWFDSILERLYAAGSECDVEALEYDLDELSYILGRNMPKGLIKIEEKKPAVAVYSQKFLEIQEG